MITVLILDSYNKNFEPLLEKDCSKSFFPVSLTNNLLGLFFSWINSYFSVDKIYVVCSKDEYEKVIKSCKGINEENIIIEPKRINYSISVFYATLFINKVFKFETIFFMSVSFLFHENFKIGNLLFALDEMAEKEWVIIPSIQLNRDDREFEFIDAGKSISNIKGFDFFHVENIYNNEDIKKRKVFGKYGKLLKLIAGQQDSILKSFLIDEKKEYFLKYLYEYFKKDDINWDDLNNEYQKISDSLTDYDYFTHEKNFLTIFLDTKPYYLDNWHSVIEKFCPQKDTNLICGNVSVKNCKSVFCMNYDEDTLELTNLQNLVIYRKNGYTAIKSIININEEVNDAISKKEKRAKIAKHKRKKKLRKNRHKKK